MDSLWWQLAIFLLVLVDVALIVVDATVDGRTASDVTFSLTIALLAVYISELILRLFVYGVDFFRDWLNFVDSLIVVGSLLLTIALFESSKYIIIGRALRIGLRVLRIVMGCCRARKRIQIGFRHLVGENKRRFRQDGFDLDLVYITSRVIVMSVPAIKFEGYYRNDINEVARFFNTRHASHYKIFNCCAEREYPTEQFNNQVVRYHIEDHNVPPLALMLDFCEFVCEWMKEDPFNIIAVHCRGGKGRSGTMICAYLLYSGICTTAEQALEMFGSRRTDQERGQKFQGVETMSQCRYVGYFEWVVMKNDRALPSRIPTKELRRLYLEIEPSLEGIALLGKWRKQQEKGKRKRLAEIISSGRRRRSNTRSFTEEYEEEEEEAIDDVDEVEEEDTEVFDSKEAGGEERPWKFFITHTEGKRLEAPLAFYPDPDELSIDSGRIVFNFHRRFQEKDSSLMGEGGDAVKVTGDTRVELRGMDERNITDKKKIDSHGTKSSRILFYFWFHTSFLDLRPSSGTVTRGKEKEAESAGLDYAEFVKADIDRGRYKGCPFKYSQHVNVRLYFNE